MQLILTLVVFNIFAVPGLIYFHLKGNCAMWKDVIDLASLSFCTYLTNPFMNIVYANSIFIAFMLFIWGNNKIGKPKHMKSTSPPPTHKSNKH